MHGPVIYHLSKKYEDYNHTPIPRPTPTPALMADERSRDILDEVWDTYGQFSFGHTDPNRYRLRELSLLRCLWGVCVDKARGRW